MTGRYAGHGSFCVNRCPRQCLPALPSARRRPVPGKERYDTPFVEKALQKPCIVDLALSSVAQLAEHSTVNRRVTGSSPVGGARDPLEGRKCLPGGHFLCQRTARASPGRNRRRATASKGQLLRLHWAGRSPTTASPGHSPGAATGLLQAKHPVASNPDPKVRIPS